MNILKTEIADLLILEPRVFRDDRGWFMESFNQKLFDQAAGQHYNFVQDNHSFSTRGVLRGMHYQLPPFDQGKLVRVTQGKVWDVAIDIRKASPTFGRWLGLELSAENQRQFWLPPGFAHGFLTLSETAEFLYKTTAFYNQACERNLAWNDPDLNISWPDIGGKPILAEKDAAAPQLKFADTF